MSREEYPGSAWNGKYLNGDKIDPELYNGDRWHHIIYDPENKEEPYARIGTDGVNRYPYIVTYNGKRIRAHSINNKHRKILVPTVADGTQQEYRYCKTCYNWLKFPEEFAIYGQDPDKRKMCKPCQVKNDRNYRERNKMAANGVRTELEKRNFAEKFVAYNGDAKKVFEDLGIIYRTNKEWAILSDEETAQYIRETQAKKNEGLFISQLDVIAEMWKVVQDPEVSAKDKAPYFKLLGDATGATGKVKEVTGGNKQVSGKTTNNIQIVNYGDITKDPPPTNKTIENKP